MDFAILCIKARIYGILIAELWAGRTPQIISLLSLRLAANQWEWWDWYALVY